MAPAGCVWLDVCRLQRLAALLGTPSSGGEEDAVTQLCLDREDATTSRRGPLRTAGTGDKEVAVVRSCLLDPWMVSPKVVTKTHMKQKVFSPKIENS